ncbi:MAG: type IV pilus modification protein PilV [Gammaproteobacteria bacterium]|nr:type IV pilus modification protein PilV [Gammaproteobacteria bacterium]
MNTMTHPHQLGSSMIEVLVSMIVLAVGILGISAMQAATLKNHQNSYLRTQAVFHSLDIVERMRSNEAGIAAGNYNNPAGAFTSSCQAAAGCTVSQMALNDVAIWEASVTLNMPLGVGAVCLDSSPIDGTSTVPACDNTGTIYAVKIWWDGDRDGTANQQYVMTFQP